MPKSRQGYSSVSKWGFPDREVLPKHVGVDWGKTPSMSYAAVYSSAQPRSRRKPRKPRLGPNRSQWAALQAQGYVYVPSVVYVKLETSYVAQPADSPLAQLTPRR